MACINVTSVKVLNNPAPITDSLKFEITFECLVDLAEDIEWKMVYVGSVMNQEHDQVLDAIDLGPIKVGTLKFIFEAPSPDYTKVPADEITGVTAVMLAASYKNHQFIRIGFYVNIAYDDQELIENPPEEPQLDRLVRTVFNDDPRVTRFNIPWDAELPSVEIESEGVFAEPCSEVIDEPNQSRDAPLVG